MFELSFQEWAKQEGYTPVKVIENRPFYAPEVMQEWRRKSQEIYERLQKISAIRLAVYVAAEYASE